MLPATRAGINLSRVATSPYLAKVASVEDTYFTGVNEHDPQMAASAFDPAGSVNPNDADQVAQFGDGISTTFDDQVSILSIAPASWDGRRGLAVKVAFRSQQDPIYGPGGDEACTTWRLTHKLVNSGGTFKLLGSTGVRHASC